MKIESLFVFIEMMASLWYFWILLILVALLVLFKPKIKGFLGEKMISKILSSLPGDKYFALNDMIYKTENGTTQIDHIVVSPYGLFIIETKNYNGWIFGNEYSEYWTQKINRMKNRFKNPIRQNYGHVKAVENLLKAYENITIIPIVAFSNNCTLKIKTEKSSVVYFTKIKKEIQKYTDEAIPQDLVKEIYNLLFQNNNQGKEIKKEHVNSIIHKKIENTEKIKNNICPKCGGDLVERNGRYGNFTGCKNYPKCRFTLR